MSRSRTFVDPERSEHYEEGETWFVLLYDLRIPPSEIAAMTRLQRRVAIAKWNERLERDAEASREIREEIEASVGGRSSPKRGR